MVIRICEAGGAGGSSRGCQVFSVGVVVDVIMVEVVVAVLNEG